MSSPASAQTSSESPSVHVLLVHGAWADGSSWSKVIGLLQAKGINAVAVQMPLASLSGDVATVKRAIALQNGPVILAGHSYGGAVITEAGNDPKVVGLVYVAAFAPDSGESVGSLSKGYRPRRSAPNSGRIRKATCPSVPRGSPRILPRTCQRRK